MRTIYIFPVCSRQPSSEAFAHAFIKGINATAARAIPGVRAVLTMNDLALT